MKRALSVVLAAITIIVGSFCHAGENPHPRFDAIREAIIEMMDRTVPRDDMDRFIVVEVADTTNFFQYASIGRDRYLFDVPVVSLSPEQWNLAGPFFESEGAQLVYFGEDNEEARSEPANYAYQMLYGVDDIDAGIELGIGFLEQVLDGRDRDLSIVRGWE
jgi:hypothetical protein